MKRSIVFAALMLAACASPPDDGTPVFVEAEAAGADACARPSASGGYVFWIEPPAVPPGASLVLQPWYTPQPGVLSPVEASCLEGVEITGPANLAEDGRTVVIDPEAEGGQAILVGGRIGDDQVSGRILVYQEETQPLVGTWSQSEEACEEATPVRELIFHPDGTFSLTWTPFEVYKDYWGTYTFDAGTLALTPEGGNHIPKDAALKGEASIDSDTLLLSPSVFGSPSNGMVCGAPFER